MKDFMEHIRLRICGRGGTNEFLQNRFVKYRNKINLSRGKIIRQIYYFKYTRLMVKTCSDIPLSAEIGQNITFPHFFGIFISGDAVIGNNCVIFQQVTIGSNNLKQTKHIGSPHIGENVYIGAGAKIIGGIHIGDNVRIGANCVVTNDVPDNHTIVLESPRIIKHDDLKDNRFYARQNH